MINEKLFLLYLLFWWLTCIFYKDNLLPNLICATGERFARAKSKYKPIEATKRKFGELLEELSSCFFCMDNWIGFFLFSVPVSIFNQSFQYLIIGFIFASISTHFRS